MVRYLLTFALLLAALPVAAGEVYRWVDEDGRTVYSDQPPEDGAEAEPLPEINVVPAGETGVSSPGRERESARDEGPPAIDGLRIVFPPAEEATRRTAGRVPVRVALEPEGAALGDGHRVRVLVDGSAAGEAAATTVVVGPLDPGPHDLQAQLVDSGGRVRTESPEIMFYLIRQAVGAD